MVPVKASQYSNKNKSIFKGIEGFPTIKQVFYIFLHFVKLNIAQDEFALRRCIFIGAMLADRNAYRSGRPGMGVEDYHRIDDEKEREDYIKIVKDMANVRSYQRIITKQTTIDTTDPRNTAQETSRVLEKI